MLCLYTYTSLERNLIKFSALRIRAHEKLITNFQAIILKIQRKGFAKII